MQVREEHAMGHDPGGVFSGNVLALFVYPNNDHKAPMVITV